MTKEIYLSLRLLIRDYKCVIYLGTVIRNRRGKESLAISKKWPMKRRFWQKACLHFSYKNILLKYSKNMKWSPKIDIDRFTLKSLPEESWGKTKLSKLHDTCTFLHMWHFHVTWNNIKGAQQWAAFVFPGQMSSNRWSMIICGYSDHFAFNLKMEQQATSTPYTTLDILYYIIAYNLSIIFTFRILQRRQ